MKKTNTIQITKALFTIAFPIVIQNLIFQLQSITDKHFIGLLSTEYVTAVGASSAPFFTLQAVLTALCSGLTIFVAQLYGQKKHKLIVNYVKSATFVIVLISIGIFFLWLFAGRYILILMQVPNSIIDYAVMYTRILSFIYLISGFQLTAVCLLQGMGRTRPIMYSAALSVILNVILDYLLILGKFGFPKLELAGAALATLISNIISNLIIIILVFKTKYLPFDLIKQKVTGKLSYYYKQILKISIPSGAEIFLWYFSYLVQQSFLNSLGKIAVTIYTTIFSFELIACCTFNSLGTAALSLSGNYIGCNNLKSARKSVSLCLVYSVICALTIGAIMVAFPISLTGIIIKDLSVQQQCIRYINMSAIILIPKAINIIVGNGIRSYGQTRWMLSTQIFGSTFTIIFCIILIKVLHVGLISIYIITLLDEVIRCIINSIYYYKGKIKNNISYETAENMVCKIK